MQGLLYEKTVYSYIRWKENPTQQDQDVTSF